MITKHKHSLKKRQGAEQFTIRVLNIPKTDDEDDYDEENSDLSINNRRKNVVSPKYTKNNVKRIHLQDHPMKLKPKTHSSYVVSTVSILESSIDGSRDESEQISIMDLKHQQTQN